MPLQIEILSKSEVESIWKNRARAENFAEYVAFMNLRDIGDGFRVTPEKGAKNSDSVRHERHNFMEAAKERVKPQRDESGKILVKDGKAVPLLNKETGEPIPEPVVLKFKVISHTEKRKVKKDGKDIEQDVKVTDKLEALVIASTDLRPRVPTEIVAVDANEEQKAAKAVLLPDGRTAKLTKSGTWRAPKLNGASTNGVTSDSTVHADKEKVAA